MASKAGESTEVVVVGAGFGGICAAISLKQKGIPFVIIEKNSGVGGTWRENTYPGSGCDVMSHLYSFSFAPHAWSRMWSKQEEILGYMEGLISRYDLHSHLRLSEEVEEMRWDDSAKTWHVTTVKRSPEKAAGERGEETEGAKRHAYVAVACICAVGQLNRPNVPPIPGANSGVFEGEAEFHTARWQHDVSLTGKRVGVIGNGATAIQFLPEIADEVEELLVFQRTPSHIIPKEDYEYCERTQWIFAHVPLARKLLRWTMYWALEYGWRGFKTSEAAFNRRRTKEVVDHMVSTIDEKDREVLAPAITPDYPLGCKRILLTDAYIPMLSKENVSLKTEKIEAVTAAGIRTDKEEYPLDVVIYSTGFRSNDFLLPMRIVGRPHPDGRERELRSEWGSRPRAFLGMAVPEYPNFFMIYGPNTNLGHNSILFMIESQVNHIVRCLAAVLPSSHSRQVTNADKPATTVEVRHSAMASYSERLDRELKGTVWHAGCNAWYTNKDGEIVNNLSTSTLAYWWRTRNPDYVIDYKLA